MASHRVSLQEKEVSFSRGPGKGEWRKLYISVKYKVALHPLFVSFFLEILFSERLFSISTSIELQGDGGGGGGGGGGGAVSPEFVCSF